MAGNIVGLNGKPIVTNDKALNDMRNEYEAAYQQFNTAALATMPTDELRKLQATHFEKATAFINNGNTLLRHVAMIASVIHSRNGK